MAFPTVIVAAKTTISAQRYVLDGRILKHVFSHFATIEEYCFSNGKYGQEILRKETVYCIILQKKAGFRDVSHIVSLQSSS